MTCPDLTWFLVADIDVERQDDEQGDEGGPPVDDEHDHAAQDCPRQRHPHVVVFEAGAPPCGQRTELATGVVALETRSQNLNPVKSDQNQNQSQTWRVGQRGVEDREIDESIRRQEEVGDDGSNDVQLSWWTQTEMFMKQRAVLFFSHSDLSVSGPTDEDEGEANGEGQDVAPQGLVVPPVSLGEDT